MIAATIAVGPEWRRMAETAVALFGRHCRLEPIVITETPPDIPPSVAKLALLERFPGQTVCYFDADARVLRPWNLAPYDNQPWPIVALDWPSDAQTATCRHYGIDPARYFAAGFWIANSRHAALWKAAAALARANDYRTHARYEGAALNVTLQRAGIPLTVLDRRHFWIPTLSHPAPSDAYQIALGGPLDGPDRLAYDAALGPLARGPEDSAAIAQLAGQTWQYHRIGHGVRPMTFAHAGMITTGAAGCERRWTILDGRLLVYGDQGGPTMSLTADPDGTGWTGAWTIAERGPVRLRPLGEPITDTKRGCCK